MNGATKLPSNPPIPLVSQLFLTHANIEIISWFGGVNLIMHTPNALFEPHIFGEPIFVTASEQAHFDGYLRKLDSIRASYYEHEWLPSGVRMFGSEPLLREAFTDVLLDDPNMSSIPEWLNPLTWNAQNMFGHLFGRPPAEVELVDASTEIVGDRIETAELVTMIISPAEDAECPICYEGAGAEGLVKPLCCDHTFHLGCLDEWVNSPADNANKCPLCRKTIGLDEFEVGALVV
jgi:hypothetical protein